MWRALATELTELLVGEVQTGEWAVMVTKAKRRRLIAIRYAASVSGATHATRGFS